MEKKWWAILVVILVVILVLIGVYIYEHMRVADSNKEIMNFDEDYYDNLRLWHCEGLSDSELISPTPLECCLSSIDTMEKYGHVYSDGDCPEGYSGPIVPMCINGGGVASCYPNPKVIEKVEDCYDLEESFFQPGSYSNIEGEVSDINEETRKVDSCIFYFVDEHEEIIDDKVCDKIESSYYFYLCRQKIVFHLNDSSFCNLEYLGKQSNVDGCEYHF